MMRIWVVVFCLLMSFPCFAQPMGDKREAIALIEQANEEFEAGEFSSALTKYRKAYRWAPDSRLLYRIGLTYESMGNYQRAREHYELFVLQQPTHEYGPRIKKKITTLRDQEKGQAFLTLDSTPAGATIFVGDEEEAAGMTPSKLPIHPGTHVVRFVMDGYAPIQDEVEVGEGQDVRRSYDLAKGEEVVADEVQDEVIVVQDIETPAAPAEVFVHQVNFGPPTSVRVLGWTGVVAGFWTTAVGIFFGQYSMAGAGLAALGLGSYGIFIHDWESGLPDVEAQQSPETTTRLQIQMKF
jgi:hypothetical protein